MKNFLQKVFKKASVNIKPTDTEVMEDLSLKMERKDGLFQFKLNGMVVSDYDDATWFDVPNGETLTLDWRKAIPVVVRVVAFEAEDRADDVRNPD